jgi:hypothetical protein
MPKITLTLSEPEEKRNFVLRDAKRNENGIFSERSLGQAALKAAKRGIKDIRLTERGTKKVHIFIGERKQIRKPASAPAPAWMPAQTFIGERKQVKKPASMPAWCTTKIFIGERKEVKKPASVPAWYTTKIFIGERKQVKKPAGAPAKLRHDLQP